ncbi:MAG: outer membrane beta-barrel family protein [Muribaculaceae bacterium]|nr:outer membrane beta-barrel family protein [Muribaculaceae bacterium]
MSHRIQTSMFCAIFAIAAMAQTEPLDSIRTQELNEVVVEAQMQRTSPTSTTYTPTVKQKNASQNAIDLLRQMAIPQIQINPVSEAVTDNAGGEVAIFINYFEASKEEMEGLRTPDVKKVEYLEFPVDPRFRGAQRVINIIVQEYAFGGYTKLTTNENFLVGFSSRNNIFSKFSYKKMTYDLYVGANNWNNHHIGNNVKGIYSLKDADGKDYQLTRTETLDGSHFKQNQYPVTFRATYASEKVQIRNTVGFIHLGVPVYEQRGSLTYHPGSEQNYTFNRNNPNRNNSLAYQGSFFFSLPNQFSIDISPRFNYMHSNDYLTYSTSTTPEIVRNARENAYNYRVDAYLQKRIGQKHTAMLGINGGDNINRLRYSGTNSYYDRFHNAFAAGMLCYNFQAQKVSLYADAGFCWEQSDINGIKNSDKYPFLHVNFRYSQNSKNTLSAYFQFASSSPGINQKASDVLQDNEYMFVSGNPLLENSRHITLNLAYTWMPSNAFGLSAFNNFFEMIDRQIITYKPHLDGNALLRTYINDGNYIQNEIGLAANYKLFNGKLQLYVSPKQTFFKSTGVYNKSYAPFTVIAQATYYLNSFYFQAYYQSPGKQMFSSSPQIYKDRNFHSLTVGWANSDWNIRVMAANVFNKGWSSANIITESPLYTEYRENIGTSSHPRINITATYTFGYGKKVQRGNEVGEQSGASSAIMK